MIRWIYKNSVPPQLPNSQAFHWDPPTFTLDLGYHYPNQHNKTMALTPNEAPSLWELGCPVMQQLVWRVANTMGGFQRAVHFSYPFIANDSSPKRFVCHGKVVRMALGLYQSNWCILRQRTPSPASITTG